MQKSCTEPSFCAIFAPFATFFRPRQPMEIAQNAHFSLQNALKSFKVVCGDFEHQKPLSSVKLLARTSPSEHNGELQVCSKKQKNDADFEKKRRKICRLKEKCVPLHRN